MKLAQSLSKTLSRFQATNKQKEKGETSLTLSLLSTFYLLASNYRTRSKT
jgi:hypothetical protein